MMIDMPLPTPFWVISSPIHMSSAVPAVSVSTTRPTRGAVNVGNRSRPLPDSPEEPVPNPLPCRLNRNAKPVDCTTAMAIVM